MGREKELAKNTIILALGKFLPKVVSLVTLPIITAQLTKTEYGTLDLVSTLIMLLMPIATLQIQSAAFRFLIDCREDNQKSASIITNIFAVTLPISVVVSAILIFMMPSVSRINAIIIGAYFLINIVNNTMCQIARGLSYNSVYSQSAVAMSFINGLGIVLSLVIMQTGLSGVLLSLCVSELLSVIYVAIRIDFIKYISLRFISIMQIKEMLKYSWPMIPNNLSNWVLSLSDRLVITTYLGIEANAVYAVANKIPSLLSLAQSVFVMAWQENASIAVRDKDAEQYFSRMFDMIFSLMISCTAVLIALTPIIFKLLIKGDYSDAYPHMPILILGMFFYCMSSFQGGIYVAHKRTKSVGITTTIAAGVNLAIDLLFIRKWNIYAGSISTLVAYMVLFIYRMIDSLKFQKMHYNKGKQVVLYAIIGGMLILCFLQNTYLNIVNAFISGCICIITNRTLLKDLLHKMEIGSRKE